VISWVELWLPVRFGVGYGSQNGSAAVTSV
jgi:hypothetical protein